MRLDTKLKAWMDRGLITSDQAEKIRIFEEGQSAGARWLVWAIGAVGTIAVAAGLISLIAANWDAIPSGVKLMTGMVLLLGALLGAWTLEEKVDGWPRDLLLLLHQGLVFGMIGLIAQVFHLSGHPWRACALAAALALPLAVSTSRSILTDVALGYLALSAGFWLEEAGLLEQLTRARLELDLVMAACALLFCAMAPLSKRLGAPGSAAALRRWAVGLSFAGLIGATAAWHEYHNGWYLQNEALRWPTNLLVISAAIAAAASFWRRVDLARFIAGAIGVAYLLGSVHVPGSLTGLSLKVASFALCVAFCLAFTLAAAESGSRRGVNAGSLALAARLMLLFFELFDSLTETGIGLIVSGLLLVAIAYGWWRLRVLIPVKPSAPALPPAGVRQ